MTLVEFLLARIAEDETAAHDAIGPPRYKVFGDTAAEELLALGEGEGGSELAQQFFESWLPDRVLAECAAKRAIVELHSGGEFGSPDRHLCQDVKVTPEQCPTLNELAAVYMAHPDFPVGTVTR